MATTSVNYASTTDTSAFTITLASLATDANLLAGRSSAIVDNTTNQYIDVQIMGQFTLGTSPTDAKSIEVWGYAPIKRATSTNTYPDVLTGIDTTRTLSTTGIKYQLGRIAVLATDNTSNRAFFFGPTSFVAAMGLNEMPTHFAVWVVHNTGVSLNATAANHWVHYLGIKHDVA